MFLQRLHMTMFLKVNDHGKMYLVKVLDPAARTKVTTDIERIRHPCIVEIRYIDRHTYSMPFEQGGSLQEILESGLVQDASAMFSLTEKLSSALQYMHSLGFSHNDVKPQNVVVSGPRSKKLLPETVVKFIDYEGGACNTSTQPGTKGYASPEVYMFGSKPNMHAADVWSLGALILSCVCVWGMKLIPTDNKIDLMPFETEMVGENILMGSNVPEFSDYWLMNMIYHKGMQFEVSVGDLPEHMRTVSALAQCCLCVDAPKRPSAEMINVAAATPKTPHTNKKRRHREPDESNKENIPPYNAQVKARACARVSA